MEIEILHGNDLAVASAGCAAFDAESRTLTRLANACKYLLAEVRSQGLAESHGSGSFALPQWRGGNGGHDNVVAFRRVLEAIRDGQVHLRLVSAVALELLRKDSRTRGNLLERNGGSGMCYFKIGGTAGADSRVQFGYQKPRYHRR